MNRKSLIGAALTAACGLLMCAGIASAQTTPSLMVGVDVSPQLTLGTRGTVALVKLDASNSSANVQVPALTFSGSFAGGAGQTTLRNCSIALTNAINIALNTGAHTVSNFASTSVFTFDTPIIIPAGTTRWLGLVCDIDGSTPLTGSIMVGVNPSTIGATNASSTVAIIPTASVNSSGTQLISGTANIVNGSTSTSGSGSTSKTPGVPNTGAGGDAASNIAILLASAAAIGLGLSLFFKKSNAQA